MRSRVGMMRMVIFSSALLGFFAAGPAAAEFAAVEDEPVGLAWAANEYWQMASVSEAEQAMIAKNEGQTYSAGWSEWIDIDARVFIGTANLREVKDVLDASIYEQGQLFLDYLYATGSDGEAWVTNGEVKAGWGAQLSSFVNVLPTLGLGVKINYFQPGTIQHEGSGDGDYGETWDCTIKTSLSTWAVTGGLQLKMPRELGSWSYGMNLMAGRVMANAEIEVDNLVTDPFFSLSMPSHFTEYLAGSGLEVDLGFQAEYAFSGPLSGVLGVGYRYAVVPQMKAQKDLDIDQDGLTDINSGDVFKDMNGNDVRFDFSGFDFSAGIVYHF
jgi:hypothetical protein